MNIPHRKFYFTKTLLTFLFPLFISLLILGSLAVNATRTYVLENINRININALNQIQETMDAMINDLNIIAINFSVNRRLQNSLRGLLRKDFLSYTHEDFRELNDILNMIIISHYARTYIHSIYVYIFNDYGQFISSVESITTLEAHLDRSWHESFSNVPVERTSWLESRTIYQTASFMKPVQVLSFFRRIYDPTFRMYNGVVVFNVFYSHIQYLLNNLSIFENQAVFILDGYHEFIVGNGPATIHLLPYIQSLPPGVNEFSMIPAHGSRREVFTVIQTAPQNNLRYIVAIPNSSMFELPNYLFRMHVLYICIALLVGLGLILYFSHNSNKQIRTIISIFESAKEGKIIAPESRALVIKNSYQYILHNIINTFIEKDYLVTQLSERKYKEQLSELMALQSQINPHFLFNTLQTIYMKALSMGNGRNEVSNMIEHLSALLRYSLDDPSGFVRLEEEIAKAKCYITIQSIRFKDAIKITWKYDDSVLDFTSIRLLLQPLLENSILHGLKEREIPGEILIVVEEEADYLSITVADTGIGIPENTLNEIRKGLDSQDDQFDHIGLYNTNRRIKLAFGNSYGISIESENGYGTIVQIKLPKIRV